jgi:hypothetical protein
MQKFLLFEVSELCAKNKDTDQKQGIDLLNDKILQGTIIENFCHVPEYGKILVLVNTK